MTQAIGSGQSGRKKAPSARYVFRLFVAGNEANSALARASLDEICTKELEGQPCQVDVVDVLEDFQPALAENILVTPALIVEHSGSRTVIFGNLTDRERVLAVLRTTEKR
jgi:hypothetical protein